MPTNPIIEKEIVNTKYQYDCMFMVRPNTRVATTIIAKNLKILNIIG